jgi:hypothetical protein
MINHGESAVSQNTWHQGRKPRAFDEACYIVREFAAMASGAFTRWQFCR